MCMMCEEEALLRAYWERVRARLPEGAEPGQEAAALSFAAAVVDSEGADSAMPRATDAPDPGGEGK